MRSLPLFKFTSRARSTSWMIALCTMFIVASFSVASGLQTSMDSLIGNFEEEYFFVTYPDHGGPSLFDRSAVHAVDDEAAYGLFSSAWAEPSAVIVTAFSFEDESAIMGENITVNGNETLAGTSLSLSGYVTLNAESSCSVVVAGTFSSSTFSPRWLLCSHEVMTSLTAADESEYNFAIIREPTSEQVSELKDGGFVVQPMAAILGFLESGVDEIQSAAMWVLVPSSFVVAILVYSFLGSEVADKRREIGILKAIGAGRRRLVTYLMADAFLITAWGAALGLALGIILSYGIATVASHMFTSVFLIEIDEGLLLLAYGITLLAGVAGTIIPAVRSTYSSPVADLKEVRRF
jgi:ABC-type antimicrobial peptide transport system permease subunit